MKAIVLSFADAVKSNVCKVAIDVCMRYMYELIMENGKKLFTAFGKEQPPLNHIFTNQNQAELADQLAEINRLIEMFNQQGDVGNLREQIIAQRDVIVGLMGNMQMPQESINSFRVLVDNLLHGANN